MDFPGSSSEDTLLTYNDVPSLAGGAFQNVGPFDVRQFNSYAIAASASAAGNPTSFCEFSIQPFWTPTPALANILYQDSFGTWASAAGGGGYFNGSTGNLYVQSVNHGPFMWLDLSNTSAAAMTTSVAMYMSTRQLSSDYAREFGFADGLLIELKNISIGATTIQRYPLPFCYGRVGYWYQNNGAGAGMSFTVYPAKPAATPQLIKYVNVASGLFTDGEFILPKRVSWLEVNNSGSATAFSAIIWTMFDKV